MLLEPPVNFRCDLSLENIPAALRDRPQWVAWRYVVRHRKETKIPFNARTGAEASSTDPLTWCSYLEAVAAWQTDFRYAGIGFVFSEGDPFCGVDLDDCVEESSGELKPWAQEIIERLGTYSELSPSGTGVKLFLIGQKPGTSCRKPYADGDIEIYDQKRFFTVTGSILPGTCAEVTDCQKPLNDLYHEVFAAAEPRNSLPLSPRHATGTRELTDEQILQKANSSKQGLKFASLWAGNWNPAFQSQSEADASLVFMLAFYTKDRAQLDRLFRRSGLMREKWDSRRGEQTYGQITIATALSQVTGQWQARTHAPEQPSSPASADKTDWHPAHLSQQINTERLVALLSGDALFNVNRGEWIWFDGRRYALDHRGQVHVAAKTVARSTWRFVSEGLAGTDPKTAFRHAVDSEKASGIAAMIQLAQTEPGIPAQAGEFDADPYAFNCLNGTLDLETAVLRPHRRCDRLTKLAPIVYDPSAPRVRFEAFLKKIMAGDEAMIRYLQRVLGRCLSGDITEQEVYFFLGEGANGKSVLIDTVLGILGDYAGTAPESLLTVQSHNEHPTEIADLCGLRLAVASETEEGAKLKTQMVKRLTGDSRLKARFMRQDFFEFDRTHKLIIVSNNKPLIRETKHAIWRRIRLVPFSVIIPETERDPQLTQKLKAEWPGILAWLVEGYRSWRREGMGTPDAVKVATQSYQDQQDPLADYLLDRCITGVPAIKVSRNDLFNDYQSWCQQTGDKFPLSRNALFDHVRSIQGVGEDEWRPAGVSAPVRGFKGIALAFGGAPVAEKRGQ
jgi:putative DNA primase/helicase